ncbi:hypothetical protein GCM10009716_08720 [Streptomyces sodiiphilus]|uniref:Integral membrane protein n=1 Tax=Streptomyces sodiiphilus TaxID=226217 RepID=A0ABN2NVQ0_9ACTN
MTGSPPPGYGRDPYGPPGPDDHDSYHEYSSIRGSGEGLAVRSRRLWTGGLMTALVAALGAAVALMLVRGVLGIPVLAPEQHGTLVLATTGALALGAAGAALVATAVLQLLLIATPQPQRFLLWIVGLATTAVVLLPFTVYAEWPTRIGTAGVYLVIGIIIGSLLSSVGRSAAR